MSFTPPFVSAFTAGLLIIIQMALLFDVVRTRRRVGQSLGDGDDPALLAAVRRHGNFAENAAIFIACFALLEMLDGRRPSLFILCAGFVLGRISHIIGLSMKKTVNPFRIGGIFLTIGIGLTLGLRLLMAALPHLGG
jgi:uncharacterized membrane protein YecN with MAPEG domain